MRISLLVFAAASWLASPGTANAYTVKRTPGGDPVHWQARQVEVILHASLDETAPPGDVRRALTIAADAWRGLGAPDLLVQPGLDTGTYRAGAAGCQVRVQDPWPFAPHLLAVTVTSYAEADGRIVDADILVNPNHQMALLDEGDPGRSRFDLAAVLTHEMGHVLGLGESDEDPDATMWPRVRRGDVHQRQLTEDDELGIAEAYAGAVSATPETPAGCGVAPSHRPRAPWGLAAVALFARLGRRRGACRGGGRRARHVSILRR